LIERARAAGRLRKEAELFLASAAIQGGIPSARAPRGRGAA
jgi:hypothetical protein